jgi:hypothetical protein
MKALFAWLVTAAWTIVGTSISAAIATEASWAVLYVVLIGIPCCLILCIRSYSGTGAADAATWTVTGSEVAFVLISSLIFMLVMFGTMVGQMSLTL